MRYREPGFAWFKTVIIDFCDASGRLGKTGEKSQSPSTSLCMGYIHVVMCRCEGCGFQAVYSGMGDINQRVWV